MIRYKIETEVDDETYSYVIQKAKIMNKTEEEYLNYVLTLASIQHPLTKEE
jgi:hypothetical protein